MEELGRTRRREVRLRGVDIEVERRINDLVWEGSTSRQIVDVLKREFPVLKGEFPRRHIPSERTLRDYIKKLKPKDESSRWDITADDYDNAVVLRVLAATILRLDGQVSQLTLTEAEWIDRVVRAVPHMIDVNAYVPYMFARIYMLAEESSEGTEHLDVALALVPTEGIINEAKVVLSEESARLVARTARTHVKLHRRMWPARLLTVWTAAEAVFDEYMKVIGQSGELIRHSPQDWVSQFKLSEEEDESN
jgi:hypothetical protein